MNAEAEHIRNLLKKAFGDLDSARYLLTAPEPSTDVICFHCQQAVEKFLKAWLAHNGINIPRTHNISELLKISGRVSPDIGAIEHVDVLTPYAVEIRYAENFYTPSLDEAKKAVELAGEAELFIKGLFQGSGFDISMAGE